jgi:hypothetical protein
MSRHSLLTACCAAALIGCGGPSAIRRSISNDAYRVRADATCGAMDAHLAALGAPRRPEEFPSWARRAAPIVESSLARLRDEKPPDALARPVEDFESALAAAAADLRQAGVAAQSGDTAGAERLGAQAKQQAQAATAAARRVGYHVCGRFPGL